MQVRFVLAWRTRVVVEFSPPGQPPGAVSLARLVPSGLNSNSACRSPHVNQRHQYFSSRLPRSRGPCGCLRHGDDGRDGVRRDLPDRGGGVHGRDVCSDDVGQRPPDLSGTHDFRMGEMERNERRLLIAKKRIACHESNRGKRE